jgi:hypothetical protein
MGVGNAGWKRAAQIHRFTQEKEQAAMKITETENSTTTLEVSADELAFLTALISECALVPNPLPSKKRPAALVPGQMHGFTAGVLDHEKVDAMAAALTDWAQFKRLREKFIDRPAQDGRVSRVKRLLGRPHTLPPL